MISMNDKTLKYNYNNGARNDIVDWYTFNTNNILNIVTEPFSDLSFLKQIISHVNKEHKLILYLTLEKEVNNLDISNVKIIRYLKELGININIYNDEIDETNLSGVLIANPLEFKSSDIRFDLLIFNDSTGFSSLNKLSIIFLLNSLRAKKKILCSVEKIFKDDSLYIPSYNGYMFAEPRIITTKVDLNNDIPYVIFEFLNWFVEKKRKVLIVTKDTYSKNRLYEYLNGLKFLKNSILYKLDKNIDNLFYDLESNKSVFFISDDYFLKNYNNISKDYDINGKLDIMVFFASDMTFDYKKLLYMCGIASGNSERREVIFLSNSESMNMINVKSATREYNRLVWECGYANF